MKKGGGSESTIIIGPSKSVLVYALHSLEYVLGLARFRVFVHKIIIIYPIRKTMQDWLLTSFVVCMVIKPEKKDSGQIGLSNFVLEIFH